MFNFEVNDGGELLGTFEVDRFVLATEGFLNEVENEGHGFLKIGAMELGVMKFRHK